MFVAAVYSRQYSQRDTAEHRFTLLGCVIDPPLVGAAAAALYGSALYSRLLLHWQITSVHQNELQQLVTSHGLLLRALLNATGAAGLVGQHCPREFLDDASLCSHTP